MQQQHVHCVRQKSVSSVNVAVIVKRLQAHFPLFSTQQNIWSPWTNAQGLSQCILGIVHGQADRQQHSVTFSCFSRQTTHNPSHCYLVNTVGNSGLSEVWKKWWRFKDLTHIIQTRRRFSPWSNNCTVYGHMWTIYVSALRTHLLYMHIRTLYTHMNMFTAVSLDQEDSTKP